MIAFDMLPEISDFYTHLLFAYYKLDSDTLESAKAPSNQIWFALD